MSARERPSRSPRDLDLDAPLDELVEEVERPKKLVGVPTLLGFALVIGALLAVVFPTRAEYARLAEVEQPDAYSVAYLEVLVRANPNDAGLRMVHVKQLSKLGRYDAAEEVLRPLLSDPHATAARALQFDLRLAHARAQEEGTSARKAAFDGVIALLPPLVAETSSIPRLRELAGIAAGLGRQDLVGEILGRLAEVSPPEARPALRAEAAHAWVEGGDLARAAELFDSAAATDPDPSRAKEWARQALKADEARDVYAAADRATIYAKRWWADVEFIETATRLSTACGRARSAREFGRRLVELGPVTDALLRAQAKRELAAADPRAALGLVSQLIARHPDDALLREARARIAEWAGDQELALTDWLWLLAKGAPPRGVQL